ncbi:DUF5129 domain-containing protein [Corynebacterium sp. H127]|uniref:DUF5129 domain-containing protein n=1 Tax=Corynebacterium sp. H127 TaxID=3133418 RepID=UPI0030B4F78D
MTAQPRTTVSKIMAGTALSALLVGGGVGGALFATTDAPERADYAITAPMHAIQKTEIHDPEDVLSAEDEARMLHEAPRIQAPDTVQQLHYIVFAKNKDNVKDTLEEYLRDNRPDLIGKDKFTDGVLIVGVGLDPRGAFINAGEDVAAQLDLRESSHLDDSLDAIKPGVKDNNIPAGLFAGASMATDTAGLADTRYDNAVENRWAAVLGGGGGAAAIAAAGAAVVGTTRRKREQILAAAREDLDFISKEYGELAGRLDGIDIRANSLTSPLAHAQMRSEWAEVRDRFLNLHEQVESFGGLTASSEPEQILSRATEIGAAATVARQVSYAEDNIDTLFKLEHGDKTTRESEVIALRKDILAAQGSVADTSSGLYQSFAAAHTDAERLLESSTAPDFLERYAMLLDDYQSALTALKEQQFSDVKDASSQPSVPTIYEQNYRPGYGYSNFVPFWAMQTWHSDAIATQNTANSSATSTTFSSGFSGAGGSSSF